MGVWRQTAVVCERERRVCRRPTCAGRARHPKGWGGSPPHQTVVEVTAGGGGGVILRRISYAQRCQTI